MLVAGSCFGVIEKERACEEMSFGVFKEYEKPNKYRGIS